MSEHILCVDDEPDVLSGFKRTLGRRFLLHTAEGGADGLARLHADGPYAVVVSDMRMPGMDGVEFLSEVRRVAPDTVRIMLTGNADQETAQAAINHGKIFRFLTKPCGAEPLAQALRDGLEQYGRAVAERDLLEHTLRGAVRALTEVLGLVNPAAFGRAMQLARSVGHVAAKLTLPDAWQFEVAAMLSQLGCVTVLPETLEALQAGDAIPDAESRRVAGQASIARDLLAHIPRLEKVAEMIALQDTPPASDVEETDPITDRDPVILGAQLLHVGKAFDWELSRGASVEQARARLRSPTARCDQDLVKALDDYQPEGSAKVITALHPRRLEPGMILADPLKTRTGILLVHDGQEVTTALLARLEGFLQSGQLDAPIRVWVPSPVPASRPRMPAVAAR